MKKLNAFLVSVLSVAALNAAVIEQVIVRQQWPWSTDVKVEYKISAVTNPVDIAVKAYNGDVELPLPPAAITGERYGITEDGIGTLVIDPVAAFGTAKVALANFKVKLTVSDSPDNLDEVLYKVFSLTNQNDIVNITRRELLNGKYGSVETDFSRIGSEFQTPMSDVLIWTAVTNDIKYKTSHLVMRKIPAKGLVWRCGDGDDSVVGRFAKSTQYYITLTEDFFIGVFELTQAQFKNIYGSNSSTFKAADDSPVRPVETVAYHVFVGSPTDVQGKGRITPSERINWPKNSYLHDFGQNTALDKLYAKTGWEFGLPTEAQWEFACRAGTTGPLYSGKAQTTESVKELAWCSTTSEEDTETHAVGLLKPNAFGLYDMLGNVCEHTHNSVTGSMASGAAEGSGDGLSEEAPIIDPVGAAADSPNRFRRGNSWSYASGSTMDCRAGTRLGWWAWYEGRSDQGFRLACPVTSQWAPHN